MGTCSDTTRATGRAMGLLVGLLLGWSGLATPASAAYPEPVEPYVNDFAGVLSLAEAESLRVPLMRLRGDQDLEVVVVTVPSFRDYGTGDTSIESFATGLFNSWGIGHRERDDGALILLAVKDRRVRIELGDGYGRAYDGRMKEIIDRRMVPRLRSGDLAGGLLEGTRELERALGDIRPVEERRSESSTASAPVSSLQHGGEVGDHEVRSSASGEGSRLTLYGFFAGLVALAGGGLTFFFRYRPRRCPRCQGRMDRLREAAEDQYLDAGQEAEEEVGSVDYDVWRCGVCGEHAVKPYRRWLTRSESCPKCGYRTVRWSSRVLRRATYRRTGVRKVSRRCSHCRWREERRETVPRLVRSDSSSSNEGFSGSRGGFGGGSSSGGGASGRW